jgi:hypothetical protein
MLPIPPEPRLDQPDQQAEDGHPAQDPPQSEVHVQLAQQ